jgi:transcriptional regulator with XRE-family HTH domain
VTTPGERAPSALAVLVGRRVRDLRTARGWTQSELGDRSGMSRPTVTAVENAKIQYLTIMQLEVLAGAFGVEVEDLVRREPEAGQ